VGVDGDRNERFDRSPDDVLYLGIGGAWIDLGSQQVHLVAAPVPRNLGQHFAIRVDDLDAVAGELRAKGIDVADPVAVGANLRPSSTTRRATRRRSCLEKTVAVGITESSWRETRI
jgi:hypothetical protein